MLLRHDAASVGAALHQPRTLIVDRRALADSAGLQNLTHIVVVEPGDDEPDIEAAIGFSPLVDPMNWSRFGKEGFQPHRAWLADVSGWYELIHTVGNAGSANVLLIEKSGRVLPDLLLMCAASAKGDASCV